MINIKKVVARLEEKEFEDFSNSLIENKAEKFLGLLNLLHENNLTDSEIKSKLNISQSAYYTLKSRLFEKIQEFLVSNIEGPKIALLQKVATIPTLLYKTNRERAKAVLTKMEKDLIDHDMPYELISVYNALKKLHQYSPKYYEYTQQYNKHVAYTLALDKVDDLMADYNKKLGEYFLSRDQDYVEILKLIKTEINNVSDLYDSHHLFVSKAFVNISYELYVSREESNEEDEPIEDTLEKIDKIIQKYPNDINYQYLKVVYNFYAFEYYHQYKIYKKESGFFEKVNSDLDTFMLNSYSTTPSKFLLSKINRYCRLNKEENLYSENKELLVAFKPNKHDIPNYTQYHIYLATSAFYAGKYSKSIDILNSILNNVSLRNFSHTDIEIKMYLALLYTMTNEYNLAENLLRSVSRKVLELKDIDYENVKVFTKIIQAPNKSKSTEKTTKILQLRDRFKLLNQKPYDVLQFLKLDDDFIVKLVKPIKETIY